MGREGGSVGGDDVAGRREARENGAERDDEEAVDRRTCCEGGKGRKEEVGKGGKV